MQLKWSDLAGTDLEKIEAHIAQENSPSVAIDVVMNIIDSSHLVLSEHPEPRQTYINFHKSKYG